MAGRIYGWRLINRKAINAASGFALSTEMLDELLAR